VQNDKALHRIKKENIPHTIKRRKANRDGHILLRDCLLRHTVVGKIKGRIEVKG
jgi:hypothetical protein